MRAGPNKTVVSIRQGLPVIRLIRVLQTGRPIAVPSNPQELYCCSQISRFGVSHGSRCSTILLPVMQLTKTMRSEQGKVLRKPAFSFDPANKPLEFWRIRKGWPLQDECADRYTPASLVSPRSELAHQASELLACSGGCELGRERSFRWITKVLTMQMEKKWSS